MYLLNEALEKVISSYQNFVFISVSFPERCNFFSKMYLLLKYIVESILQCSV